MEDQMWEKVEPNVWKPDKAEESIEGIIVNISNSTKFDNKVYHLETPDQKQMVIFGTTVLDDRMSYLKVGDRVRIVYKGVQKNAKKQDTKIFQVFRGKEGGSSPSLSEEDVR